jgi:hypothetical protein
MDQLVEPLAKLWPLAANCPSGRSAVRLVPMAWQGAYLLCCHSVRHCSTAPELSKKIPAPREQRAVDRS